MMLITTPTKPNEEKYIMKTTTKKKKKTHTDVSEHKTFCALNRELVDDPIVDEDDNNAVVDIPFQTQQQQQQQCESSLMSNCRRRRCCDGDVSSEKSTPKKRTKTSTTTTREKNNTNKLSRTVDINHVPVVPNNTPFSAYSVFINTPGTAPHDTIADIESYTRWFQTIEYRSELWKTETDKHMSSSKAGNALWGERYKKGTSEYSMYIMERGYYVEPIHVALFAAVDTICTLRRCDSSFIHHSEHWISATPDAFVHNARTNALVGLAEFKTHLGDVHKCVDKYHMCQVQIAMQVMNASVCYLSSLAINDKTHASEWVVILVHRSDEYWHAMIPHLKEYCVCVLSGVKPRFGCFIPPDVHTEVLIDFKNVLDLLPHGGKMFQQAKSNAARSAHVLHAAEVARNTT